MKLATKAAIGTASVVFVASLLILFITAMLLSRSLSETAETRLKARVERELSVSSRILDRARRDVKTIALGPVVQKYLDAGKDPEATAALGRDLATILSLREEYYSAKFIDAAGVEVARADMDSGGKVVVTPEALLQDKSHRDYYEVLRGMAPGETLAGQISLNREFGEIEYPYRPTIRLLAPVHDAGGVFLGGVILNMSAAIVLPPRTSGEIEFRVVLPDGSYALHPYREWEFGSEFGNAAGIEWEFGVDPRSPEPPWSHTLHLERRGIPVLGAQGWLVSDDRPDAAHWRVIASLPEAVALAEMRATVSSMAFAVLLVAALTSLIGMLAARRITRQAQALSEGARRVTAGDFQASVAIDGSDDELTDTARAFNAMTARVRDLLARDAEIREELSRLNTELLRSNEELENFARVTSHDLKSPLRPLAILPDWIEEDLPEIPDEVREHLDEMRSQAARMTDLVDGLLRYSLAGTTASHASAVDARELVHTVLATLGTGAAFEFDLDLPEAPVFAVQTELDIIIRNLVQNAIKHHDRASGRIGIAVRAKPDAVEIEVADDGPGIPEAYRTKVLEPLVTLVSRDEGGGSGLGLAIVAKIARRLNGGIEVLANDGVRGTVFRVSLKYGSRALAA